MILQSGLRATACGLLAFVLSGPATASDVHYVPTSMNVVDAILELGGVGPGDFLVDLGSGDGRISIRAAKRFGTRGFGVEIEPHLVQAARDEARKQGVADKVTFETRDLFGTDLGRASVITAYLLPSLNLRLRPQLFEQLKPGSRILTHDFDFGDWQPDRKLTVDVPDKPYGAPRSDIMLWVVPADFSGVWQWTVSGPGGDVRYEARIEQRFQVPSLALISQGLRLAVSEARIRGNSLSFAVNSPAGLQRFSAELSGNTLKGQAVRGDGPGVSWMATRIKAGKMDIGTGGITPVAVGN